MKNPEMFDLERLEQLIQRKSYFELSKEEKEWVSLWIKSQEEYENLRNSEIEVRKYFQYTSVTPNPETLEHLTKHLRIRSRESAYLFWQLKPTFGALLISIFLGGLGWWIGNSSNNSPQAQALNPVVVYDTIFVATKPDTVVREKIIYRDRPVILTTTNSQNETAITKGVSMKEKEELDKLLVSGTD